MSRGTRSRVLRGGVFVWRGLLTGRALLFQRVRAHLRGGRPWWGVVWPGVWGRVQVRQLRANMLNWRALWLSADLRSWRQESTFRFQSYYFQLWVHCIFIVILFTVYHIVIFILYCYIVLLLLYCCIVIFISYCYIGPPIILSILSPEPGYCSQEGEYSQPFYIYIYISLFIY